MNALNYIIKKLHKGGTFKNHNSSLLIPDKISNIQDIDRTTFEHQFDNFKSQFTELINSSQGLQNQKYMIDSIQKLQPQKPIELFDKFINICIGLFFISTIGSLFMYKFLNNKKHWSTKNELTFIDCFYFHCATLSTVGYGDITAISKEAKIYTILLIVITMVEVVAVIDVIPVV